MKILASAAAATLLVLAASPAHCALPGDVTAIMDETVDPCNDFFQYACGGWVKHFTLPDGVDSHERPYTELGELAMKILGKILEQRHPVLGEFYDSCLDMKASTALGNKPLQDALQRIQKVSSKFELAKLGGELGPDGAWLFTSFDSSYNEFNQTQTALFATTGTIPFLEDVSSKFAATSKYILTAFKLAGVKLPSNTTKVVEAVIDINDILLSISPSTEEQDAVEALRYQDAADRFPIGFKGTAEGARVRNKSSVKSDSDIFFDSIGYFDRVEKQLWNSKSLEDLKYFYSFLHIIWFGSYLGDDFMANEVEYYGPEDRLQRCQYQSIRLLPDLLSEYYFEEALGARTQQYVLRMVQTIERMMADELSKATWLDLSTRVAAERKIMLMKAIVGKQDKPVKYTFKLNASEFADNYKKIKRYNWETGLTRVGTTVDRSLWDGAPGEANARYSWFENKFMVFTSLMQAPYFNTSYHPSRNFGGLGATIGHEITHGFDWNGREFDALGLKTNWWTENDRQEFEQKAQCMREQYSEFIVRGATGNVIGNIDGNFTLNENIADNGGLKLAFEGLRDWLKNNPNTPSNGMTAEEIDKLFFVAAGQEYCAKVTDAWLENQLKTDPHSNFIARVNVLMSNSDDFAKTFKCKVGSKMNPAKKCVVW